MPAKVGAIKAPGKSDRPMVPVQVTRSDPEEALKSHVR